MGVSWGSLHPPPFPSDLTVQRRKLRHEETRRLAPVIQLVGAKARTRAPVN